MRKVFAFSLEEKSGRSISGAKVIGIMSSFMWRCTITLMLAEAIFEKRRRGIFTHQSSYYNALYHKSLLFNFFSVFCLLENESPGKLGWPQHLKIPWWPGKRATATT